MEGPTRARVREVALALARREGRGFAPGSRRYENLLGSLERFTDIALHLGPPLRVLDVGTGDGLLPLILSELGHRCTGLDVEPDPSTADLFRARGIPFVTCNAEADPLPFPDSSFDAVTCCQVMEHFTHSPLPALAEMRRVLVPGGLLEVDVPNAACYRNRSRLLRGKHITWDYGEHYLRAEAVTYNGKSYFPGRHNREFTRDELGLALREAGFEVEELRWISSMRHRPGLAGLVNLGAGVLNAVPSLRKTIIAYARRPLP